MQAPKEVLAVKDLSYLGFISKPALISGRAEIAAAFAAILAVMTWIEFAGPAILDNDGYYHIRWAAILRESAPRLPDFQALPLTTLNQRDYADHHFLFHVLLVPFTFGDLRVGAKLAAAIFASVGIASLFALLVAYRVSYRWLWLAPLVASSEPFLYRMSMTRAPSLSLALLGIGAYLILQRKPLLIGFVAFAFTWTYSLFPLILVFAVVHAIAVYVCERRIEFRQTLVAFSGIALGLVVNPYFPRNLALLRDHLLMKLTATYPVEVGGEWYPYDTWALLGGSAVAFSIYAAALVALDLKNRRRALKPLFFLLISLILLLMFLKSKRFVEYWPPFAITFSAIVLALPIRRFVRARHRLTRDRIVAAIAGASVTVVMAVTLGMMVLWARADVRQEADPLAYQGASQWLERNAPVGARVFNTDWDDFPMLFYYNPTNEYIVGLDPTYLYDRDSDLWKMYSRITLGQESSPASMISGQFGAEYVFTDNDHTAFLRVASEGGDFETVYRDRFCTVLRIRGPAERESK
jgi:hypothetical protein